MENTEKIPTTVLFPDGTSAAGRTEVISEHVLDVAVNERPAYRIVCSKNHLKELVVGRLKTDGLIDGPDDIDRLSFCRQDTKADVFLNRAVDAAKSAGLKKLPRYDFRPEWVFALANEFAKGTQLHDRTCGTHVCILAREGKTLFVSEDMGRHNAVDKAVGYSLLNGTAPGECMLFTSGRVPTDMVEKVIAAGVPVLVSKSVPTSESAEMAARYGLTLICRAWPDRCEILRQF